MVRLGRLLLRQSHIMNGRIIYARVYKRSFTNCLHGKAAERAVLTEITVLKLKNPSSTFTVKYKPKNLRNLPSLMAEA